MVEIKQEVFLGVSMGYKVVNNMPLSYQQVHTHPYLIFLTCPNIYLVFCHVPDLCSGHAKFMYLPISGCMVEMNKMVSLGVAMGYEVVNSMSLPL